MRTVWAPPGEPMVFKVVTDTENVPLGETLTAPWVVPTPPTVIEFAEMVEEARNPCPVMVSAEPEAPLKTDGETEMLGPTEKKLVRAA